MSKRNRICLNESQLRNIIRESIANILCESRSYVSATHKYYPLENEEIPEELINDLPLDDYYDITFGGDSIYDEGDYYTPPYEDFDAEVTDDGGFRQDVNMIQDENLRNCILKDFEEWCDNMLNDYSTFSDSEMDDDPYFDEDEYYYRNRN